MLVVFDWWRRFLTINKYSTRYKTYLVNDYLMVCLITLGPTCLDFVEWFTVQMKKIQFLRHRCYCTGNYPNRSVYLSVCRFVYCGKTVQDRAVFCLEVEWKSCGVDISIDTTLEPLGPRIVLKLGVRACFWIYSRILADRAKLCIDILTIIGKLSPESPLNPWQLLFLQGVSKVSHLLNFFPYFS